MKRAIVLISGGMDSLVTAAIACRENDEVHFLHASYGQRTQAKELICFENICSYYQPASSRVLDLNWLSQIGGSALTDSSMEISKAASKQGIPNTYVPFRNANLLCAAVAWAEVIKAGAIYIGAVEEDSSGYPDCRELFFKSMQTTIETGTKNTFPILIKTPVIHKSKAEIVKIGMELHAPFQYSWSCYKNTELACGVCDSCHLRLKAFALAGLQDPIPYEIERS
ncbi:MAG: 7-cyano-7-deazaguanine synthase QueC [Candidatus Cloacimonadaceae bacterium]|nr:7-cyano-7-deazaguanine synthase QueC [Candidatus Cloacimonadaceae bacterium]